MGSGVGGGAIVNLLFACSTSNAWIKSLSGGYHGHGGKFDTCQSKSQKLSCTEVS